jgi:hypothetical protein
MGWKPNEWLYAIDHLGGKMTILNYLTFPTIERSIAVFFRGEHVVIVSVAVNQGRLATTTVTPLATVLLDWTHVE